MSFLDNFLEPGERVVYRARTSIMACIVALTWLGVLLAPGRMLGLISTELALTDRRLIGKVGVLRPKSIVLPHKKIEGVRIQQGLLGKLFGYGAVTIVGTGGNTLRFRGIAEPVVLQWEIDEAVEVAVLGRKLSDYAANTL